VNLGRLLTALETLHRRFEMAAREAPAGDVKATLRNRPSTTSGG